MSIGATSVLKASSDARQPPIVCLVDDDPAMRQSLGALVSGAGLAFECFSTAEEFLARPRSPVPGCLLLDVDLPGSSGLDLQRRIAEERLELPIVFVTQRTEIPITVQAMKAGAIEYLTKPVDPGALLAAVREGLERSQATLVDRGQLASIRERYARLTCRERQVMSLVVSGLLNKQTAAELSISEITVKAHRGRVMRR